MTGKRSSFLLAADALRTVEATILLAAARTNPAVVLREAASTYKVDTDGIALKVKQEFAAKEKARRVKKGPETDKQKRKQAA
jgi:ParB family chromosome partitioning protein